jgi:hypothetical protein
MNRIRANIVPILLAGILLTLAGPRVVGFAEDTYASTFPCGIGVGSHTEYVFGVTATTVCDNEPSVGTRTQRTQRPANYWDLYGSHFYCVDGVTHLTVWDDKCAGPKPSETP